jgi:O-antigen ligase
MRVSIKDRLKSWRGLEVDEILLLVALFVIPFDRYALLFQPSGHSPGTTLGKVLVGLLLAMWLVKVVFLGNFKPIPTTLRNAVCVLSIFFLWSSFISTINSRSLGASAAILIPRINLVIFMILMFNIIQSWEFFKKCVFVLLFSSAFVCLAGFYEMITQTPVLESTYTLSQARTNLPKLESGSYRIQGFGGDPDYHGSMLTGFAGLLLFYVFKPGWKTRLFAGLFFGAYLINIVATGSRSVWVGFAMLLGTFFLFAKIRFKWLLAGAGAGLIAVIFVFLTLTTGLATTERFTTLDMDDPAIRSRMGDFYMGAKMVEQHPVIGIGVGNFFFQYYRYSHMVSGTMSPKWRPKQVQNGFVQIWAEQGTLGIIIFLALLAMVFKELFVSMKRRPTSEEHLMLTGLMSCYFGLLGMMMFIPLTQQESTWIIFALSIAAARLISERRSEEKRALAAESVPVENLPAKPAGT